MSAAVEQPKLVRRYVRHLLAFGVSVAVGVAPLLGRTKVPGFTAILALFPLNLQQTLIAFAAFLMGLPAVAMQFYADDRTVSESVLRRWFVTFFIGVTLLAMALLTTFTLTVAEVPFYGGRGMARYVVGSRQLADCPCRGKDIESCVGRELSFDPLRVERCYSAKEVRLRKLALSLLYTATMFCFGGLIGILILREERRAPRWRIPKTTKPFAT